MNLENTAPLRTIRDFVRYAATQLSKANISYAHGYDNPYDEAGFLVLRSLGIELEYEDKFLDAALTQDERQFILNQISRRCDELVPTAYLTKEWWLTGHRFFVDDRVLIPRSFIAELIEEEFQPWVKDPEEITSVLDMCTGSGCLAILASECFPNAEVDAVDISEGALEVAEKNIADYGLEGIVRPIQSDLFTNLAGKKYDVIITNPPYVTTEAMEHLPGEYRHEPELALVAGEDGMDLIKTILEQAKEHLNDGGLMFVELGDGKEAFENRWPELNVVWLPTSGGDDQVFMIRKEDLP